MHSEITSAPETTERRLRLTTKDQTDIIWRVRHARAAIGSLRAATHDPRVEGGIRNYDPTTQQQLDDAMRFARVQRIIDRLTSMKDGRERWGILACAYGTEFGKDDARPGAFKPFDGSNEASAIQDGQCLAALAHFTPAAQERARAVVLDAERERLATAAYHSGVTELRVAHRARLVAAFGPQRVGRHFDDCSYAIDPASGLRGSALAMRVFAILASTPALSPMLIDSTATLVVREAVRVVGRNGQRADPTLIVDARREAFEALLDAEHAWREARAELGQSHVEDWRAERAEVLRTARDRIERRRALAAVAAE